MGSTYKAARALSAVAVATALALAGCSGGSDSGKTTGKAVSQSDIDKAMNTPTTLTFWTWVPNIKDEVALFEKKYPQIKVNVVNVGNGSAEYTKLRTALKAGNGAPDVAQIEYQFISSFRLTDNLEDLSPYGAADLAGQYVPWVWNQVSSGSSVWAVPQDTGPIGNLYRNDLMTRAGITSPPATWAEYAQDAATVKAKTGAYISDMPGSDPGQLVGLFWQAGGKPFGYDGKKTVKIDLDSAADQKVVAYWQDLIQKNLVAVDPDFNDAWYQGFTKDKYAGWIAPAWAPVFLQGAVASTAGKWRVANVPQWAAGENVSGNWGGSSDAVMSTSKNKIAAYELTKFINNDAASTLQLATKQFLYPSSTATLKDPTFMGQKADFYGGQQVNQLFAQISSTVDADFQWLPFMDYVYSSFNTTLGKAIADKGDLKAGLTAWQQQVVAYAKKQGFTVQ